LRLAVLLAALVCSSCGSHRQAPAPVRTWPPVERAKITVQVLAGHQGIPYGGLTRDGQGTVWVLTATPRWPSKGRLVPISPGAGYGAILLPVGPWRVAWNGSGTAWFWNPWGRRQLVQVDPQRHIHYVIPKHETGDIVDLSVAPNGNAWFVLVRIDADKYRLQYQVGTMSASGDVRFIDLPVRASSVVVDKRGDVWFVYGAQGRQWSIDPKIWHSITLGGVGVMHPNRTFEYFCSAPNFIYEQDRFANLVLSPKGSLWFLSFCGLIGHVTTSHEVRYIRVDGCPLQIIADNKDGAWFPAVEREGLRLMAIVHIDDRERMRAFAVPDQLDFISTALDRDGDVWIATRVTRPSKYEFPLIEMIPPPDLR